MATEQTRLGRKVGKSVQSRESATSLQLSLEDEAVEKKNRSYREVLLPVGTREKDAVGLAFAINGQFNTADIYGDPDLFQKLWPRLIESAANEAIALHREQQTHAAVSRHVIRDHILEGLNSPKTKASATKTTRRLAGETQNNHTFETRDEKDRMFHLNIIKK